MIDEEKKTKKLLQLADREEMLTLHEDLEDIDEKLEMLCEKESPEFPTSFEVSNFPEISFKELENTISDKLSELKKSIEDNGEKVVNKKDIDLSGIVRAIEKVEAKIKIQENISYKEDLKYIFKALNNIEIPKVDLSPIKELIKVVSKTEFPKDLVEYNRVKVVLSEKQIKEIGNAMSVSVSSGGGIDEGSKQNLTNINDNTSNATDLYGGGKVSVGTTAVEATITGTPKGIIITADKDNTGILYVGKSNVTNLGANAITYLEAGDHLEIDYNDTTNAIYVVASAVSQNFWKGAIL